MCGCIVLPKTDRHLQRTLLPLILSARAPLHSCRHAPHQLSTLHPHQSIYYDSRKQAIWKTTASVLTLTLSTSFGHISRLWINDNLANYISNSGRSEGLNFHVWNVFCSGTGSRTRPGGQSSGTIVITCIQCLWTLCHVCSTHDCGNFNYVTTSTAYYVEFYVCRVVFFYVMDK